MVDTIVVDGQVTQGSRWSAKTVLTELSRYLTVWAPPRLLYMIRHESNVYQQCNIVRLLDAGLCAFSYLPCAFPTTSTDGIHSDTSIFWHPEYIQLMTISSIRTLNTMSKNQNKNRITCVICRLNACFEYAVFIGLSWQFYLITKIELIQW